MSEAPSQDGAVIRTQGLTRRFGTLTAVDSVDLDIRQGEVYGFLGPNGAGKTTLIRMLMGLLTPSEGQVQVLGFEIPRQAENLRSKVGYMAQHFSLYEDLSVEENLDFAAEIFGGEGRRRQERIEQALQEHHLVDRRQQRPATLSGGWRQRLALAAATIHAPELLFLDEPTAGVDPANRRAFWEKLFELSGEGVTILVSTHYMDEAIRCHRLCMMRQGRKAVEGAPRRLARLLQGRVIEVQTRHPDEAIAVLRTLPCVSSAAQMGSSLHVLLTPDGHQAEMVMPDLVDALDAQGLGPVEAEPADPNLEDVFVALTLGEELQAAADGPAEGVGRPTPKGSGKLAGGQAVPARPPEQIHKA